MSEKDKLLTSFIHDELLCLPQEDPISDTSNLIERGLDSLKIMRLIVFIEESYGVTIPDEKISPQTFSSIQFILSFLALLKGSSNERPK